MQIMKFSLRMQDKASHVHQKPADVLLLLRNGFYENNVCESMVINVEPPSFVYSKLCWWPAFPAAADGFSFIYFYFWLTGVHSSSIPDTLVCDTDASPSEDPCVAPW